jgi:hypothetical protein
MTTDHTPDTAIEPTQPPEKALEPSKAGITLTQVLNNPHKLRMVELAKSMLSEGLSYRQTARATKLSHQVVSMIAERFETDIGTMKSQAARQCRRVHTLATEAAIESLERHLDPNDEYHLPPNLIPIYTGVFVDKDLQLSGEATSRQEVVHTHNTLPLQELYDSLPQARKADPAPIDIDSPKE